MAADPSTHASSDHAATPDTQPTTMINLRYVALALDQAAPLRPLPDRVTDLDHFRVRRHDRAGGVIDEYRLVA
jgi:hypothetical protein